MAMAVGDKPGSGDRGDWYRGGMGLFTARNLRRAKELLEKNRHKVGDVVGKTTEKIDKASGGKTSNLSKKAEEAARKYSAGSSATHHGAHPDVVSDGYTSGTGSTGSMSNEEIELRRAEAQAKAATAVAGLANAANGFLAKAQARVDAAGGIDGDTGAAPMPPPDASTATDDPSPMDPPPLDGPPPLPNS